MRFSTTMIDNGDFESRLELPKGNDPNQNAWLTITIRYYLNFVDGWNEKAGVTVERDEGKFVALDADKRPFPIVPWDAMSKAKFAKVFQTGENIWNYRFVLITPQNYDGLDYESSNLDWKVRPNVLCLFRLVPAVRAVPHLSIDVVRLEKQDDCQHFRSHETLYTHMDLYSPAFGHELGHAIGLEHIMVMKGDKQCKANPNAHRCYGVTKAEQATWMGSGKDYITLFAKPWLDRVAIHTEDLKARPTTGWTATLDTNTPTRKIPMGVVLVGEPSRW